MVMQLPERDKLSMSLEQMTSRLAIMMGGRVAEELIFGREKVTSGAASDIEQATRLARMMVTRWGLSEELGTVSYGENQDEVFLGMSVSRTQNASEATVQKIDSEIKRLVEQGYNEATKILTERRVDLETLAKGLLEFETLTGEEIQDLLKEGDEVIVQVVKDPIGSKGARITCHISLPGRHLVFMPTVDHVGISRRIENEKERRRLRELVDKYRPQGTGFIVRTVAENEPEEKLTADIKFLLGLWNEVGKKRENLRAPALVHPDLDLVLRSVRDLFSDDVSKLVIDDRAEFERVRTFVADVAPELRDAVELYTGDEPIFDEFGIEQELQKAQNRKVWLKSGGYIIIDQTEALVAIDVNSGRYVGKKGAGASLEDTITKINCEAAKEIVYQLRLRNIGGIIIIDFIDMDKGSNREKVFKTLQEALGADRAKTNVLKISDIGLVEMTRKRVRESVTRLTTESCPICDGRGHVRSRTTMAYEIMREVQRAARKQREDQIVVSCHPEVAKLLQGPEREAMRLLMMKLNKSITVRPQPQYHVEQYDLHGKWSRPELQQAQRGLSSRGGAGAQRGNGNDRNDRRRDDRRREGEARPGEPAGQAKPELQPAGEKVGD